RRTHHRAPLRRHPKTVGGAAAPGRHRKHGGGDRTQPRRDQVGGLGDRPRTRGRPRRWRRDRHRNPRGGGAGGRQPYRPIPRRHAGSTGVNTWSHLADWSLTEISAPAYAEDVLPLTLELLDPRPGERLLDVGCGEGGVMRAVAASGADVVGIDGSLDLAVR